MAAPAPATAGTTATARWTAEAACRGRLDLFFAPHGERPQARARREAAGRQVCATCPVCEPCRQHARATLEQGLWGGETEEERIAVISRPTAAAPA